MNSRSLKFVWVAAAALPLVTVSASAILRDGMYAMIDVYPLSCGF